MTKKHDSGMHTELSAQVREYRGRPTIFINDRPRVPVLYGLTHAFGGRLSWEEVPQRNLRVFGEAGIRLFHLDVHYQDIWTGPDDELDIAFAQRQIAGVIEACNDAAVVLRVHVNAPYWWNETHPEECTEYADGPVETVRYGPPFHYEDGDNRRAKRASLASAVWRREAGERLRELCTRVEATPEGRSVIGIHVACGIYGEWHYWGFTEHEPDVGPAMTTHFRRWLTAKYGDDRELRAAWGDAGAGADNWTIETVTVPGAAERDATTHGVFRDPGLERRVIDYFTCQQEVVADDIEFFAEVAKRSWSRPIIVGVFYGYFHGTFGRQAVGGHLCVQRILDSPNIDYVSAPQTYHSATRRAGGSGNSRGVVESALLHGKLWLDEMDNGHLQSDHAIDFVRFRPRDDQAYLQVLKRSTLLPVLRGGGFWYYDFGAAQGYGWWDGDSYQAQISRTQQFFKELLEHTHSSEADALFVWSMDAFHYLKQRPNPISDDIIDDAAEEAFRCGVAADHIYDFDLGRLDLSKYRAVVFMNTFSISQAQAELIRSTVACGGRTIVWNYLPGVLDGEHFDTNRVGELTGISVRQIDADEPKVPFELDSSLFSGGHVYTSAFDPMIVVDGTGVQPLARIKSTEHVAVAERRHDTWVSVLSAVPLRGSALFRSVLERAGCHVYTTAGEVTVARCGMVMVHSNKAGDHEVRLRNGRIMSLHMSNPETIVVDGADGRVMI